MQTWLITGANGNLGKRLLTHLLGNADVAVVAVVRSERAKNAIEAVPLGDDARSRLLIKVLDYTDTQALRAAAAQADKAVHLVGILKQTRQATYHEAHEASTAALLDALADTPVDHLTYLSIAGSSASAANECLSSKGRAEEMCAQNALNSCVLRVPMVLGEGDYASYALKARAGKAVSFTFRAASLEQPIYAGDVVRGIVAAGELALNRKLDLGGPEVLSRRALTQRAASLLGRHSRLVSLPIGLGMTMAGMMERLLSNPPVTRAMLDVLDHDDDIDPQIAMDALQLSGLTSLDDTLRAVL